MTRMIDDEWRRWIAENLLLEASPEAVHAVLVEHGFEREHALCEIDSTLQSPYFQAGSRLRNRLRKREWMLSVYGELNRMRSGAACVERRVRLSRDANVPFVGMEMSGHEFVVRRLCVINMRGLPSGVVLHTVHAPISAIPLLGVWAVTVARIVPVADIDGSIGSVLQIDTDVLRVAAKEHVRTGVDYQVASTRSA